VSLLYTTVAGETVLALDVASPLLTPVTRALAAHYPGVRVTGPGQSDRAAGAIHTAYLRLVPDTRSLRLATDFEDQLQRLPTEPVSGLLAAVADRQDGLTASIRFSLEKISARRRHRAKRVAALAAGSLARRLPSLVDNIAMRANGTFWERLSVWPLAWFSSGEPPRDAVRKLDDHLYRVTIELNVVASPAKQALARKRLASLAAAFAPFTAPGSVTLRSKIKRCRSLLSAAELAALWHPPVATTETASMRCASLPHLPAPVELKDSSEGKDNLPLGRTVNGQKRLVGIRPADRLHQLVIGKSGMGKSTLLHTQIAADIAAGRGVGLVDPHGDLVDDVLQTIPRHRTNEVVVLDPTNPASPTINPLACRHVSERALVAENNLAALSKVFGFDKQTAPRLLHILRYTLLALVSTEFGSYLSIRPMLTDKQFRKRVVDRVEDAEVRSFFVGVSHQAGDFPNIVGYSGPLGPPVARFHSLGGDSNVIAIKRGALHVSDVPE